MPWFSRFPTRQHNTEDIEKQQPLIQSQNQEQSHNTGNRQPRLSLLKQHLTGFVNSIHTFFAQSLRARSGSYTLETQVLGAQGQAHNRELLSEIIQNQRDDFTSCLEIACSKAQEDLSPINKDIDVKSALNNALLVIQRNPSDKPYTQSTLEKDVITSIKLIFIRQHLTELVRPDFKQKQLGDEGSISTMLTAKSTDLKLIAASPKDKIPMLSQKLAKEVTDQAITMSNYTQAKKETVQNLKDILISKGKNSEEISQSAEMKSLETEITKKALELEEQATIGNGGILPAISKEKYIQIFTAVITQFK